MRKPALAALASLIAGTLLSVHAHALDLMQVYQEALANDAQFASARATLTAGQERAVQARAGLLPVIGLGGAYSRADPPGPISAVNTNTYAISLSQPLFRLANWETYQQGKLSVAISEAPVSYTHLTLPTKA